METLKPKLYSKAPLPFVGQKRNFLKPFKTVINEHIKGDGQGWTIIDVFGGSGLLANNAKHLKPAAHVIYNDFDGYIVKEPKNRYTNAYGILKRLPTNDTRQT